MGLTRLRYWRLRRGLRMYEVAQALGISESLLSVYETGRRSIPDATLTRLARLLNVPPSELVGELSDESVTGTRLQADPGH